MMAEAWSASGLGAQSSIKAILRGARPPFTVLHGSGSRAHWPLPRPGSSGADVLRASELQHAVQDLDRHVHLSRPTLVRARAQPVPDHALEPADGGLGPGARIVARGLLPGH